MSGILFLDFETKDRGISAGLGAGWPYKGKVDVIGFAYSMNGTEIKWSTDTKLLKCLVEWCNVLVAHNAAYELGVLRMLDISYDHAEIIDTMLWARLYDNQRLKYGLDDLASSWLGDSKSNDALAEVARELKLVKSKSQDAVKYAKANMDVLYQHRPDIVKYYAIQDVNLLIDLYNFLTDKVPRGKFKDMLSDLQKAVVSIRSRGILVSIDLLEKSQEKLECELATVTETLKTYIGDGNPNSTSVLVAVLDKLNIEYPRTPKGNPSVTSKWVESQSGEFFTVLNTYRKLNKLKNDFVDKIKTMIIEAYGEEALRPGSVVRMHPELNILAASTGRFSSCNFNVQQLPKRDPYAKPLVRGFVVPEEGEDFYCLDFSGQEPRMQVHYAAVIGSKGGKEILDRWNNDPKFDMHSEVAKMCGIPRSAAKTINLGLSYGMGLTRLSESLKVDMKEAKNLQEIYHTKAPYLKDLISACKTQLSRNKYIRSLLGRRMYKTEGIVDKETGREIDFSYKGVNQLIQGSSADQTSAAIVMAYRYGINLGYPIHDELTLSSRSVLDVCKIRYIMENCCTLLLQSKTDVTKGPTFADQSETVLTLNDSDQEKFNNFVQEFTPIISFK